MLNEGGSSLFSKEATAANIKKHMTELSALITNQGDPKKKLSEAEFNQQKGIILSQLQSFTGDNEALKGLYGNTAQIELQLNGIKSRLLRGDENGNRGKIKCFWEDSSSFCFCGRFGHCWAESC